MLSPTLLYSGNRKMYTKCFVDSKLKFYNKIRSNFYVSNYNIFYIILWKCILKFYVLQLLKILSLPV